MRFLYEPLTDIPIGFKKVEYLESTGTQWIDTGIIQNISTELEVNCSFTDLNTGRYGCALGGSRFYFGVISSKWIAGINSSSYNHNIGTADTQRHIFKINKDGFFIDGTNVYTSGGTSPTNQNIALFTCLSGTDYNTFIAKSRCHGVKIYDDGVLVRDFIPVLDWNMTPCMYDKVTEQLFYNQGSGDFLYGREIHYVDYLESDGTQYIDTGYLANSNTKIDIDFTLNSHENSVLFGGRTTADFDSFFVWSEVSALNCCRFDYTYRVANNRNGALVQLDTKSNIVKDKEKNYLNGIQYQSNGVQTFQTANNAYLFAGNNGGTANYFHKGKIFSAKIYDNDKLIRNYMPAIDENGVGYMFDKITHTLYANAGTGLFKYPARETEYIEVTDLGTNNQNPCIDLGLKYKSSMSIESKYTRTGMGVSGSILPLSNGTTQPLIYMPALNANAKTDRFVWRRQSLPEASYYYNFADYPMTVEFKVDAVNDALTINGNVVKTGMIAAMNGYTDPYESYTNLYMLSIKGTYGGMGKVYYVKLYDTTQVYRDLIPVWKDGVACMYDKEHDVFYYNSLTGTVICGKIVEPEYE